MGNLKLLQDGLKKLWTNELYSGTFNASPLKHKDFDHALKHVFKAAARLQEMTEEVDHSDEIVFDKGAIRKYLSDLIISTIRLANVCPIGEIDIEASVFDRIERKMGVKIEPQPELVEALLKIKNARTSGCTTGEAISKSEYWAREALKAAGVKE